MSEMIEYEPFSCFIVELTASKTRSRSLMLGYSCGKWRDGRLQ
jgi:hypothetical protein